MSESEDYLSELEIEKKHQNRKRKEDLREGRKATNG